MIEYNFCATDRINKIISMFFIILVAFLFLAAQVKATSTIEDTATSSGEVLYLVNCSAPCTVNLTNTVTQALADSNSETGYTWGAFNDIRGGVYNLSVWEGAAYEHSVIVSTGAFNVTLTGELNERLGKATVGAAIMLGVGLTAILLGMEGGFLILGIGLMITAEQGFFPGWVIYVVVLIAAALCGVGLYRIWGTIK